MENKIDNEIGGHDDIINSVSKEMNSEEIDSLVSRKNEIGTEIVDNEDEIYERDGKSESEVGTDKDDKDINSIDFENLDNEEELNFDCGFCDLKVESKEEGLIHVQTVHAKELSKTGNQNNFSCTDCKKVFKKGMQLYCHNKAVHEVKVTICEYCSKEFKNKTYHKKHVKTIHEASNLELPCDKCSKTFKSSMSLYHHKRAVHERSKDMICFMCAKVCKNRDALMKHIKFCQTKAKTCPDGKLPLLSAYSENIRVEGNLYICKFCEKEYPELNKVTSHIRVYHTDDPVSCHICDEKFQNVHFLKTHYKKIHKVTDVNTVNQFTKDLNRQKLEVQEKRLELRTNKKMNDLLKKTTNSLELEEKRKELVSKWKQIEEEGRTKEIKKSSSDPKLDDIAEVVLNSKKKERKRKQKQRKWKAKQDLPKFGANENDSLTNIKEENEDSSEVPWSWTKMENLVKDPFSNVESCKKMSDYVRDLDDNEAGFLLHLLNKKEEADIGQTSDDKKLGINDQSKDIPIVIKHEPLHCTFPECKKIFHGSAKLKEHIKNVHKPLKRCPDCLKEVKNLSGHIKDVHAPKEVVICPVCAKMYNSKSSLRIHTLSAHAEKDEAVICHLCAKTFDNLYSMKNHIRFTHNNMNTSPSPVSCDKCGKQFTSSTYLKRHRQNVHSSAKICQYCNKSVKFLRGHIKDMHSQEKEQASCPYCEKIFDTSKKMRFHTKTVHTDEDLVNCPSCERPFANPYYMKTHLRLVHGNDQSQVSCDECEKLFPNGAYLQQHKKVSHEDDISSCVQCGGNYKNKSALGRHIRYAHNGTLCH